MISSFMCSLPLLFSEQIMALKSSVSKSSNRQSLKYLSALALSTERTSLNRQTLFEIARELRQGT